MSPIYGYGSSGAVFETRSDLQVTGRAVSIAVGDFNGDGYQDMAIADTLYVWIYLGNGNGTFQKPRRYVVGVSPQAVATGDLTGDGLLDLVVTDYLGQALYLLRGKGDGTFQVAPVSKTTGPYPLFVGLADINGDHKPDIVVLDDFYVSIFLNNGSGSFGPPIETKMTFGTHGVGWGDFNGDGKLDLAVGGYYGATNELRILLGNGDGTFQKGNSYFPGQPTSVAVADLRNNGKLDLAIGSQLGDSYVLLGNGDGTFQKPLRYETGFPTNVLFSDVNHDNRLDLVEGVNFIDGNPLLSGAAVLLGNGDGTFQPVHNYLSGLPTWTVSLGDLNGDKQPDLILGTDYATSDAEVLLNTGVVTFLPTTAINFQPQLVGSTSSSQIVTLHNSGRSTLTISSISIQGQFAMTGTTCGNSLAPAAHCKISTASQPNSKGSNTGTVTIKDNASSKPQTVELTGAGTVVSFTPPELTFPPQKVGTQSSPQQVLLTNTGTTILTISQIQLNGHNWQEFSETNDCGAQIEPGTSCTITVVFAPRITGAGVAEVDVTDNGGGGKQSVALTGSGT